jgi:hypothetical protein
MSEPYRSDIAEVDAPASGADRDAKIEQLLLLGLDHYFANRYELSINVWTRVLFLDRSHARARAYIERARSAQAERQRESEELLHNGVSAFQRGDGPEARRLLVAAIEGGAPSDEALVVLERLNRIENAVGSTALDRTSSGERHVVDTPRRITGRAPTALRAALAGAMAIVVVVIAAVAAVSSGRVDLQPLLALTGIDAPAPLSAGQPPRREMTLALPHRGDMTLTRARALNAAGHLHEALGALETIRTTDPQKGEADRLRADIQRQLLALTAVPSQDAPDREKGSRRIP